MSRANPNDDPRQRTDKRTFRQTDEPWKQPVEKEQNPKGVPEPDLERWRESDTH